MKALIFGINGQDGFYLNEICNQNRIDVIGVSRSNINWIIGDVGDREFVELLIKKHVPEYIFHMAANSTTKHEALFENHKTIATGTWNILECAKLYSPSSRIFITGSGVQFKNTEIAIKETDEFEANSVYSVSRIHSVYAARYFRRLGLKVYVGYLFHHESPFRKHHHISKMTTDIVKRIACGSNEKITIGNVEVKKEWAFARDIAEGIFTLVNQENIFEATIGTGIAYSIKDWLIASFNFIGKDWKNYTEIPNQYFLPEYKTLLSNPSTMLNLGWYPKTDFLTLNKIMLS